MSLVAVPARLSTGVPSPQLTVIEEIVPSESVAVNDAVTVWPMPAGLGVTEDIVTTGDRSLIVSMVLACPDPPEFVAVTMIVKFSCLTLPVDA